MLNIATVFSGIGAFEQALKKQKIDYNVVFACDNGERYIDIDEESIKTILVDKSDAEIQSYIKSIYDKTGKINYVKESYFANYNIKEDNWYDDIRFIDGKQFRNKIDIFVGGSPCQSFSSIGKRYGLEDARGTLFYDYARLIKEIAPKVFIFENVTGLLTHDKGKTWEVIHGIFKNLGYKIYSEVLNSKNFGIPQSRRRLFVVGFKDHEINFSFPKGYELKTTMFDYLDENVENKYYLGEKGFNFVTNPAHKNRAQVNMDIIKTQKANQQFNWNGDFVFKECHENEEVPPKAYLGTWNAMVGICRQLTPRECLRLMGFPNDFKIVVPDYYAYRQSGNSIVVNVLEGIVKEIINTDVFNHKIKLATVFSGIGSVEFALKRMNIPYDIVFACDNGERDDVEIDSNKEMINIKKLDSISSKCDYVEKLYNTQTKKKNYVQESYMHNYDLPPHRFFQDIRLLDGLDFVDKVDILVGGSPCQSFSSVGQQYGLDDTRGTLFYEFARLVNEIKPKVFIYENVRNLLSHDKGKTWEIIKGVFYSLGYNISYKILNASDYGIPQTRRRLFVVGYKDNFKTFIFPNPKPLKYSMHDFLIDQCAFGNFYHDKCGELVLNSEGETVDRKYYLTPLLYNYVMKSGTKNWSQKPKINMPIARTLLKTMGNRHRAGVDNYVSDDGSTDFGMVRMLTEREALRLMGYTDDFKIVVSKSQAYKQAGNSIVVDIMMSIISNILKDDVI